MTETVAESSGAPSTTTTTSLQSLIDGLTLQSVVGAPPLPSLLVPIHIFYAPDDSELGTLYWCDTDSDSVSDRSKNASQSIVLSDLVDVRIGKQSAELKSSVTHSVPSSQCFTLVTEDRSLNLITNTESQRKEILDTIKLVFKQSSKKAANNDTGSGNGNQKSELKECLTQWYHGYRASIVQSTNSGQQIRDVTLRLDDTTSDTPFIRFTDASSDTYTANDRRSKRDSVSVEMAVRLNELIDVVALASDSPNTNGLTFVTLTTTDISVVLDRTITIAAFAKSIQLLKNHYETSRDMKRVSQSLLTSFALSLSPLRSLSPSVLLTSGSEFLCYTKRDDSNASLSLLRSNTGSEPIIVVRRVTVTWERDASTRYGYLRVTDTSDPSQSHRVTGFTEILSGKRSTELTTSLTSQVPSECCLSLIGNKGSLHLQASTETQRNAWIDSIRVLYSAASKKAAVGIDSPQSAVNVTVLASSEERLSKLMLVLVQGFDVSVSGGKYRACVRPTESLLGKLHVTTTTSTDTGNDSTSVSAIDLTSLLTITVTGCQCALVDNTSQSLTLTFSSLTECRTFTNAIHALMMNCFSDMTVYHSRTVFVAQSQPQAQSQSQARYELVNTKLGLNELHSIDNVTVDNNRNDSIVSIKLPWITLFAPSEQLLRLVMVWTPSYGLGFIALPIVDRQFSQSLMNRKWVEVYQKSNSGKLSKQIVKTKELIMIPFVPAAIIDSHKSLLKEMKQSSLKEFRNVSESTPMRRDSGSRWVSRSGNAAYLLAQTPSAVTPMPAPVMVSMIAHTKKQSVISLHDQSPHGTLTSSSLASLSLTSLPLLRFGHLFQLWSGAGNKAHREPVMLFLDCDSNRLYYHSVNDPQRSMVDSQSMAIDCIVRVLKGKQAPVLQSQSLVDVDASLCVTIMTLTQSWSLQCLNDQAREEWICELKTWMLAIEQRLLACGSPVTQSPTSMSPALSRRESTVAQSQSMIMNGTMTVPIVTTFIPPSIPKAHRRAPSMPQSAHSTRTLVSIDPFLAGCTFIRHEDNGIVSPVHLFYDPRSSRLGSLYWCDVDQASARPTNPSKRLPLVSLADLTIGKSETSTTGTVAPFSSRAGQEADPLCCFSLSTRKVSLHLQALDSDTRDFFIERIKRVIQFAGKKVIEDGVNQFGATVVCNKPIGE